MRTDLARAEAYLLQRLRLQCPIDAPQCMEPRQRLGRAPRKVTHPRSTTTDLQQTKVIRYVLLRRVSPFALHTRFKQDSGLSSTDTIDGLLVWGSASLVRKSLELLRPRLVKPCHGR